MVLFGGALSKFISSHKESEAQPPADAHCSYACGRHTGVTSAIQLRMTPDEIIEAVLRPTTVLHTDDWCYAHEQHCRRVPGDRRSILVAGSPCVDACLIQRIA